MLTDPSPRSHETRLCPTKSLEGSGIGDLETMVPGQVGLGYVSWVETQRYLGSEPQFRDETPSISPVPGLQQASLVECRVGPEQQWSGAKRSGLHSTALTSWGPVKSAGKLEASGTPSGSEIRGGRAFNRPSQARASMRTSSRHESRPLLGPRPILQSPQALHHGVRASTATQQKPHLLDKKPWHSWIQQL